MTECTGEWNAICFCKVLFLMWLQKYATNMFDPYHPPRKNMNTSPPRSELAQKSWSFVSIIYHISKNGIVQIKVKHFSVKANCDGLISWQCVRHVPDGLHMHGVCARWILFGQVRAEIWYDQKTELTRALYSCFWQDSGILLMLTRKLGKSMLIMKIHLLVQCQPCSSKSACNY